MEWSRYRFNVVTGMGVSAIHMCPWEAGGGCPSTADALCVGGMKGGGRSPAFQRYRDKRHI